MSVYETECSACKLTKANYLFTPKQLQKKAPCCQKCGLERSRSEPSRMGRKPKTVTAEARQKEYELRRANA